MNKRFAPTLAAVLGILQPYALPAQADTYHYRFVPGKIGPAQSTGGGASTGTGTGGSAPDSGTPAAGTNDGGSLPPSAGTNNPPANTFTVATPPSLRARVWRAFTFAMQSTNGQGAVTWSSIGDAPPQGIALGRDGVFSGTPTAASRSAAVQVLALDGAGNEARSSAFAIEVVPAPAVSYAPPDSTQAGGNFTLSPTVTDAYGAQAWRLVAGTLPPGLQLDAGNGTISGQPTDRGTFGGIAVAVTDAEGAEGTSAPFSITVDPAPVLSYGSATLDLGPTYTFMPAVSGLTPPYTFALTSRSGAANCTGPDSLGALTCSQTAADGAAGTYGISVKDTSNRTAASGDVTFTNGSRQGFSVGDGRTVFRARSGSAFSGAVSMANAPGNVRFGAVDPLPPGFSLDVATGAVTATSVPDSAIGTNQARISGTSASGRVTQRAVAAYGFAVSAPLSVTQATLQGQAQQGNPFTATGSVANVFDGGTPKVTATGMPDGLSVTASGGTYTISGTPAQGGTFAVAVTAVDPADGTSATATTTFTVGGATVTADQARLTLVEGDAASFRFTTNLSNPTWTFSGNPPWLSLSQSGAALAAAGTSPGTSQAASWTVTGTATSNGVSAKSTVVIDLSPASATYVDAGPVRSGASGGVRVSTSMGAPGTWTATGLGGTASVAVASPGDHSTTVSGTYPANATSGPVTGGFEAVFTASNAPSSGQPATNRVTASVPVYPALAVGTAPDATYTAGSTFSMVPPAVTGRYGYVSWKVLANGQDVSANLGAVIPGLQFDVASGRISGTPTGGGSFRLSYRAHDDGNNYAAMAADADTNAFTLSGADASASASDAQPSLKPGDSLDVTVTTSIDAPTWSLANAPSWVSPTPTGKTLRLTGIAPPLAQAGDYAVTVTATNGSAQTVTPVRLHVDPVTASLANVTTRSGRAFAAALTSNYPDGKWAMQPTSPPDVTFSGYASRSFPGTAPADTGTGVLHRQMTAALQGAAGVAASSTLTVYPDVSLAAPADQSAVAGNGLTLAPPQVYGAIGSLAWQLQSDAGADMATGLGTACPGLSFAPATGVISGSPQSACSVNLRYAVTDAATGADLQESATSRAFVLTVAAGQVSMTATPSTSVTEGDTITVTATSNIAQATWSATGTPPWMTFQVRQSDGAFVATAVTADVPSDTTYPVTVTASGNGANASTTLNVTVKAATASVSSASVRSGGTFTMSLSDTMKAAATWTATSDPDVTGLATTATTVTGTAPSNTGGAPVTRAVSATHTANASPVSGSPASSSGTGTLTVQPALTVATVPAVNGTVGSAASVPAPSVGGQVGTLTYTLLRGTTDVSATLGATCKGLQFSKTTGAITGTPTATCSQGLTHKVSDDGAGNQALAATAQAAPFTLNVTNASVTASTGSVTVTEGDSVAFSATTTLPSPTWSVSGNPAWMTFADTNGTYATSTVSGDVSTATTYPVVLTATSGSTSAQSTVNVTVSPATVSLAAPPPVRTGGTFSAAVSTSMSAAGSWSATSSPADVTLLAVSGGNLTGKAPANAGAAAVTRALAATYTGPAAASGPAASATGGATLTVYPALSVAAPSDQSGQAGASMSFAAPAVTGRAGSLTYALLQGSTDVSANLGTVCPGLAFSTSTGVVSGAPSGACNASLSYKVSDDGQPSPQTLAANAGSTAFNLAVTSATASTTTSTVSIVEGSAASFTATTSIPTPTWTVSGNPAWMTFSGSGGSYATNSVSADIDTAQAYTVTLNATNASGATSTSTVTVNVSPATSTVGSTAVRSGASFSVPLSTTMAAAGAWTVSANPADVGGLAVSGSTLSGTAPANTGASALTRSLSAGFRATNPPSAGNAAATPAATGTLTVQPAFTVGTVADQAGTVGSPVSVQPPSVGGAVGNLTYALKIGSADVSSNLGGTCPGLQFSSATGIISGTPTSACSASLTHTVSDNGGGNANLAASATSASSFSLTVTASSVTASAPAPVTEGGTVTFSATTSLPNPTWSVSGNPAWMTFTSTNGTYATSSVSGDVTVDTTYNVVLTATSGSFTAQKTVPVTVTAGTVSLSNPAPVRSGGAFSATVNTSMTGGTWSASSNPADATGMGVASGSFTGTAPANTGTTAITRTLTATYTGPAVTSGARASASGTATLTVQPNLSIAGPASQVGQSGTAMSFAAPTVTGRSGTLTYAMYQGSTDVSGNLGTACAGLQFNTSTGAVSGTPSGACSATLSYKVTDDGQPSPSTLMASATSTTFSLSVQAATSTANPTSVSVVEGSPAFFSVSSSLSNPTFTVTGKPDWMTFTQSGGTYSTTSVSPHSDPAQSFSVTVTASNGTGVTTVSTVPVAVATGTGTVGSANVRSGAAFSVPLGTNITAAGAWTANVPADVTNVSVSNSALSGTAPSNPGTSAITRSLGAAYATTAAPTTGTKAYANASAGTLTVQPALTIQSQSARTASVGTPVSYNPPTVNGLVGTASYALLQGSTDVSDTIGQTCGGLQFSRSTGILSGTPSAVCSPTLSYKVSDNGNGDTNLTAVATSPSGFSLTVGNATVTATNNTPNIYEGDTVSISATTSLPNPTWTATGNPAWMTFTSSGGSFSTSSVSADVPAATGASQAFSVTLTATSGSYSAQQVVTVVVNNTVIGPDAPNPIRAGASFSFGGVVSTMKAPGTWTITNSPNEFPVNGPTNGVLSGTAPTTFSGNTRSYTINMTYTANRGPSTGATAFSTNARTVNVWNTLAFASAPAAQTGAVGTQITAVSPPSIIGQAGTITYKLFNGATEVTNNLGSVCGGLSFSPANGQITGTPTASCTPSLTYVANDDGNAIPTLVASATSAAFPLTVTNSNPAAFSFGSTPNVTGATTAGSVVTLTGMTAPGNLQVSFPSGSNGKLGVNGSTPSATFPSTVPANARLEIQMDSVAGSNGGTRTAYVTVGNVTGSFTVTTVDSTPNQFNWPSSTGLGYGGGATSSQVQISGITTGVQVSASAPGPVYFSVNGGTATTTAPVIYNGQTLAITITAAKQANSSVTAYVTIGGVTGSYTVTTGNDTPSNLNCASGTNYVFPATGGQEYYCDVYTTGMSLYGQWAASGSVNRVYTDATGWTTARSGTLAPNARIVLAVVAPGGTNGGSNVGYFSVGSAQQSLTVRTGDTQPDGYGWAAVGNQPINTFIGSNYVGITGIDQPTYVQVSGGAYVSINGAGWSSGGTIYPGQSLAVALTTSGAYDSPITAYTNVGGVGASWTAYTGSYPCNGYGNSVQNRQMYYYYNRDVQNAGFAAVLHWIRYGYFEGRRSCFQLPVCGGYGDGANDDANRSLYYQFNPDVAQAGVDPYQHYIDYGRNEGRISCWYDSSNQGVGQ